MSVKEGPRFKNAILKVQVVETRHIEATRDGQSLGQCVDQYLIDCQHDGRMPNKVVLEIDPPECDPPNRV